MKYTLTDENVLVMESTATTTKKTPLNVANHAYFNLEGNPKNDISDNLVQVFGNKLIDVKEDAVPTGKITTVNKGDVEDFYSNTKNIPLDIDESKGILKYTKGYDFAYILEIGNKVHATAYSPVSGIKLKVVTDRPVMHLYDAHDLDGSYIGKNNIAYNKCCALCLEGEAPADAVNHENFYNTIVSPGETYRSTTEYRFLVA